MSSEKGSDLIWKLSNTAQSGKPLSFGRLFALNLVSSYVPGLLFLLIAQVASWEIVWMFVAVTPVALPIAIAMSHISYGESVAPIVGGGAILSVLLVIGISLYCVKENKSGRSIRQITVLVSVSSVIQALIAIGMVIKANA